MTRRILHVDADAFYASIEQRDQPQLRGKPVAIGWSEQGGVVLTASYEARTFGVKSAMPSVLVKRLCPELIFVPARLSYYRSVGAEIKEMFGRYTDVLEPVSIDESYLDVTTPKRGPASGTLIGRALKRAILQETGLTMSVGVAHAKFYAKLASGMNKPDGLTVIRPEDVIQTLAALDVSVFHGVGPVTARRLKAEGIRTGADLQRCSREELESLLGSFGSFLHRVANGTDDRPVKPRIRKSYGAERTFGSALPTEKSVLKITDPLCEVLATYLSKAGLNARTFTLTLKLKDTHYKTRTRSVTPLTPLYAADKIRQHSRRLLTENLDLLPLKLVGMSVSHLAPPNTVWQPLLFDDISVAKKYI